MKSNMNKRFVISILLIIVAIIIVIIFFIQKTIQKQVIILK